MNPVNDYLTDYLNVALKPLIDRDFVRIVKGDGTAGAYLTEHRLIEELNVTGAASTHDAIVWAQVANRKAGTPTNKKRFTSELGAVCPTIVVPGPWFGADLKFQAELLATQKLYNSGFVCVAFQVLIMPKSWDDAATLMDNFRNVIAKFTRQAYYPGAGDRLSAFNNNLH